MAPRALAPVLVLALPLAALACGSTVTDGGLFGSTTGSSSTGGAGGGAVTSPVGTGGGAPTTTSTTGTTTGTTTSSSTTGTTGTTTTGTTTTTTTTGAGGAAQVCASFGDACTGCMSQGCADTWCACAENAACLDLLACMRDCAGDQGCNQDCYAANPDGISAVALLSDCAGTTCKGSCAWGAPIGPCQTCLASSCTSEYDACVADAECLALYQCLKGCQPSDLVCQQGCYDQHGDGVPRLQALLDCSQVSCVGTCN